MYRSLPTITLILVALVAAGRAQSPSIEVTPTPVVFGCTLAGEDSARTITVRNTGSTPITIIGYRTTAPFLAPTTRDVTLTAGASTVETLRFQPLTSPGFPSTVLVVETSDGDFEVPLRGEIGLEPSIGPSMSHIPYYDVTVGATKDTCIVVRNESCRPLTIDSIVIDNGVFRISRGFATPYVLAAFAEDELCVSFTPDSLGDHFGRLTFYGDLGKRALVRLDGRGVRAEVAVETANVDFGFVDLGATTADTIIFITNRGTQTATLDAGMVITGANPGDFILSAPTLPLDIAPTERVPVRVRFRPTAIGARSAQIVVNNSTTVDPIISLRGTGSTFDVTASPDTVDMGGVYIGSSRLAVDTIIVRNRSTRTVTITTTRPVGGDASSFNVLGFITVPIAAGTDYALDILFTPSKVGPLQTELVGTFDNGSTFRVVLLGVGLDTSAPRPRRITGDSISMRVGERKKLHFAIEPPFAAIDGIKRIAITLGIDPRSLYPHGLVVGGPANGTMSYNPDGTIAVTLSSATAFDCDGFDIEFEGLFTGQPLNSVSIQSVDVGNPLMSITTTSGVVRLDGCDIAANDSLARAVRIVDVAPNPTEGTARVRYNASAPAVARVVTLDGRVVQSMSVQTTESFRDGEFQLEMLLPGVYIVDIASGDTRDQTILIVNK